MSNFIRKINSKKWKQHKAEYIFTIADMDVPLHPPFKKEFLQKIEEMNGLTYKQPSADYYSSIRRWYSRRFLKDPSKEIKDEEILTSCSVFTMTNVTINYFTEKGDGILVFTPCYIHYYNIIKGLGRVPIEVDLTTQINGLETRYQLDFQKLQQKAKHAKIFIFVNPNNISGRVWSKQQIDKIVEICRKYNLLFVSDEILCDLIPNDDLKNFYSMVNSDYDKVIVGNNIGKPFNVSSAKGGYVIIRNKQTREKYKSFIKIMGIDLNEFATIFTEICYTEQGLNWLQLIQKKIVKNYQKLKIFAKKNHIYLSKRESAFLVVIGFQNYMPYILQEVERDGICSKDDVQALLKFLAKREIVGIAVQTMHNQTHICNLRFAIAVEEPFLDRFLIYFQNILKALLKKTLKNAPLL